MTATRGFTAREYYQVSPSILEAPCSNELALYMPASPHSGPLIARHKSLPSFTLAMRSTEFSPSSAAVRRERAESTNSLRRSVSGMKRLLPLKLSSSLPTSIWSSSTPFQRSISTVEQPAERSTSRTSHQSSRSHFKIPHSSNIQRKQYRDTPVYTEPGSPLLNLVYYQEERDDVQGPSVEPCNESSSFDECSDSNDGDTDSEVLDEETPLPQGLSPARTNRRSRSSELSFKCLGEAGEPLFRDESAWLSSPLSRPDIQEQHSSSEIVAEKIPVEHDIEAWLSMSETSSISGEEDADSYTCSTISLTHARAQVVDVNAKRRCFKLPPRSDSLGDPLRSSPTTEDGCQVRSSSMEDRLDWWNKDDTGRRRFSPPPLPTQHVPDLAMTTPPHSPKPKSSNWIRNAVGLGILSKSKNDLDAHSPPPVPDATCRIISDLEESTSNATSGRLHPRSPCISAIRKHLKESSNVGWEAQPPVRSPFSEGVDWRPQPNRPSPQPRIPLKRTFSSCTARTAPPLSQDWASHDEAIVVPDEPNLQHLAAIFPRAPHAIRSTLYAYILAYLFLISLPDRSHVPLSDTPPPSPPYILPYFTTTRQSLPNKAADRLGLPLSIARPRQIRIGSDAIILRHSGAKSSVENLTSKIRATIGSLIGEMEKGEQRSAPKQRQGVDETFLRALGEIVKGCEQECFVMSRI